MIDTMSFLKNHFHELGWTGVLSGAYWFWKKSRKQAVQSAEREKAGKLAVEQVNAMATNHLPHMETALQSLDKKSDDTIQLLTSIDKNIAILVDRTPRS